MSRVDLPNGQWAELRERLTYAQAREVRRALLATNEDPLAFADFDLAVVRAYVTSWHVLDIATGTSVGLDTPEAAPDDVLQPISRAAIQVWNGSADPKGMTAS